jgi:molybdopterin synthase sulfur carrier subunit
MKYRIILFGQLCDIAGSDSIVLENIADTDKLQVLLKKNFPALASSNYVIAIDKKLVVENTSLHENSSIALLPPFSGG